MRLKIEGKIALVSGGTAGIGFAIAARLAGEGAKVVIAGRSEERARGAMERLEVMAPGRVAMCLADMTEKADVAAAVAATRDRFGSPDIAISNVIGHKVTADAEGPPPGFFRDVGTEEYAHEFRQLALSVDGGRSGSIF
ncbi:MAG: SDR family NAD(P)-dependent oxidoreductase [Sphingobium sp.]